LPLLSLVLVGCTPSPKPKTQEQVLKEFYAAPLPEKKPYVVPPPPTGAPPAEPPRECPKGNPISYESSRPDCPEPPSDEALERRATAVQWVREHCEAQSYPVSECEVRCRSSAARDTTCEAECESYQAYAECPMVKCPKGTDPAWKGWYYQAECRGPQAKLVGCP